MHRTRNAAYGQPYRGFESLPLRQMIIEINLLWMVGGPAPVYAPLAAETPDCGLGGSEVGAPAPVPQGAPTGHGYGSMGGSGGDRRYGSNRL
jgi:hypothetical protein